MTKTFLHFKTLTKELEIYHTVHQYHISISILDIEVRG